MKFLTFVMLAMLVAVASAQFGDYYQGSLFGPDGRGFAPFAAAAVRDPRQNTGPVVFPPSPPGNPEDTSGVIVGASGYGFVPPAAHGYFNFRFRNYRLLPHYS